MLLALLEELERLLLLWLGAEVGERWVEELWWVWREEWVGGREMWVGVEAL